jgi:hypothetical protein
MMPMNLFPLVGVFSSEELLLQEWISYNIKRVTMIM